LRISSVAASSKTDEPRKQKKKTFLENVRASLPVKALAYKVPVI
jgi:isocitrate lyase